MGATVLVVGEQLDGVLSDTTYELVALARALAGGGSVICAGGGPGFESGASSIAADAVCVLGGMGDYVPEAYAAAISALAAERGAEVVLAATSAVGLDTAAATAAALGAPLVSYVVGATREGSSLVATSQLYGGKLLAESEVEGGRAVLTVVPGSTAGDAGRGSAGAVENVTAAAAPGRMTFRTMIRPDAGGVDITKEEILVSVGRGIESQDNIELIEELATAIGGTVSASRPIIDSGWLPKARQVGKSGVTVKPKLYLAVGISGAPEHLQGMKDAEFIVAINSDANAPIFDVADYGICGDLFDIVPALTECATQSA